MTPPLSPRRHRRFLAATLVAVATLVATLVGRHETPGPARSATDAAPAGRALVGAARGAGAAPGRVAIAARAPDQVHVRGTVIDRRTGAPVPDVDVVFADGTSETSTLTDHTGRYSLTVPAGRYRPFVEGAGVVSTALPTSERLPARPGPDQVAVPQLALAATLELRASVDGVDLEVDLAGQVRGRVVDRDGVPIGGAIVRAAATDLGKTGRPVRGTDVAETGGDGTFELELAAASYRLDAFHDRYGGVAATTTVTVEPRAIADAELTMHAGCVVAGRVVRADGQPIAGGALERSGSDDDDPTSFVAAGELAADGSFVWSTVDAMSLALRAWPWRSPPSPARRFECTDGARFTDVVFVIPDATPDLSGRVVTADGRPAPFAFVDVRGESEGTLSQQERADADGAWAVYALPAGTYRVTASVDGAGAAVARVHAPAQDLDLRLSGTGALAGAVAGLGDGPVTITAVACALADQEVALDVRRVVSVVAGRYLLDGLPACQLVLQVEHRGQAWLLEATVDDGRTATLDLDLAAPDADPMTASDE